ncbi:MAG: hypothetical protein M5R41_19470 [Bacteroidia bacterium]|nr:hypothetical protein [Bacteroidia bacterium]
MRRPQWRYSLFLVLAMLLAGCAASVHQTPGPVTAGTVSRTSVYNCGVLNTAEDEFAPLLLEDGRTVLFTSSRRRDAGARKLSPQFLYGEAVYHAVRDVDTPELQLNNTAMWNAPELYHAGVLDKVNTGAVTVDAGREVMYVSGTYVQLGEGGADIYTVPFPGVTSGFTRLENVNSPWWDAHPAVSPDGSLLVFSSERIGSQPTVSDSGSRSPHLWMSVREGGAWSRPELLPQPVNSDAAEVSPFFGGDGSLYFATSRWSDAGYDIVRTRQRNGIWEQPERLPEPVNSEADDLFPFITPDRKQLLFASNRTGGAGGYDIWGAEMPYCLALVADVRLLDADPVGSAFTHPAVSVAMEVLDAESNALVEAGRTDDRGVYASTVCLKAGKRYLLRPGARSCYVSSEGIAFTTPVPEAFSDTVFMQLDLRRLALPEFHVVSDSIPFFVTGYWYPNTTAELGRLRDRLTSIGDLPNAKFVDTSDYEYDWAAERVDAWFGQLYESIERMLVPMMDSCYTGADTLVIRVLGYVDPRGLAWGRYDENIEVRTVSSLIRPGAVMQGEEGNAKLSHLRAYFAREMIDREMERRSPRYTLLRSMGRLRLEADGGNIGYGKTGSTRGPVNDPLKRKFTVAVEIRGGR